MPSILRRSQVVAASPWGSAGGSINIPNPATGSFSNNEVAVQYRGSISGPGILTVTGGTSVNTGANPYLLELGNTSSYTGSTTISNAIVCFENFDGLEGQPGGPSNILPTTTVLNLVDNGWFDFCNYVSNQTIAGLTGDATGRLANTNGEAGDYVNLTINPAVGQSFNFLGVIGAQTILTKAGANYLLSISIDGPGLQIFTGVNTYSGSTTISAGTLQLGNGGATGSIADSAVTDNSVLAINRSDSVSLNSLIAGNLTGSGRLVQIGPGTLIVTTSNGYSGGTAINGGTLEFYITSAMPAVGTVTVASSATLAATAGGANQFTNATSGPGSIGGLLAGIGGQGAPVVWTAKSILGIDTTSAIGGTFTYHGNITDTNSGTTSLGLAKLGAGTLVLAGTNSYSGGTAVDGGTLSISSDSNLGAVPGVATSASITLNTSTLQLNFVSAYDTSTINSNRGITLGSGGGALYVAVAASGSFSINEAALQYRGIIRGSGNLLVSGGSGANSGTNPYILELGSQNLYSGATTVSNAIVCVANEGSAITNVLPNTTVLNLVDDGWFNLNSGSSNQTIAGLAGDATGRLLTTNETNRVIVTIEPATGHSYNFPGVIGAQTLLNKTGSNSLMSLVIDGQGTQILSGVDTYSGTTLITAGTLQLGNGGSTGSISASVVTDNGTLAVSRSDNVNLNSLISGALTGSGGLVQNGPGVLTLTTTNTYSGGTIVLHGSLILDGASSLLAGSRLVIGNGASAGADFTPPAAQQSDFAASAKLAPVPEPATMDMLTIAGLVGLGLWYRRTAYEFRYPKI